MKPFDKIGFLVLDAEVSAQNPFDLPVTVADVNISMFSPVLMRAIDAVFAEFLPLWGKIDSAPGAVASPSTPQEP